MGECISTACSDTVNSAQTNTQTDAAQYSKGIKYMLRVYNRQHSSSLFDSNSGSVMGNSVTQFHVKWRKLRQLTANDYNGQNKALQQQDTVIPES